MSMFFNRFNRKKTVVRKFVPPTPEENDAIQRAKAEKMMQEVWIEEKKRKRKKK